MQCTVAHRHRLPFTVTSRPGMVGNLKFMSIQPDRREATSLCERRLSELRGKCKWVFVRSEGFLWKCPTSQKVMKRYQVVIIAFYELCRGQLLDFSFLPYYMCGNRNVYVRPGAVSHWDTLWSVLFFLLMVEDEKEEVWCCHMEQESKKRRFRT